ncbi:hypothetical protein COCSADRAFT_291793 [Bipolaris sorokiniana ND90Pr]|uniref:Uncharacterized protein n=1 Tax=Cochliobolus sativus (strain ND90Pr / ATCC 201652) TaxID=665912 RepID=M2SKI8_COCSN|nr:uncharacterized protein COCSADRAFT_291793 [Bipolaris sorokiniana ND90Pr]EMD67673.1 hypothetical protein COCSADRAFT_291793 [Bipolaris sorokiniana ND90Pr]
MTTVIYRSIAAYAQWIYMVASSGGLPFFDNKAFWGLVTLMHPLSAFGCPHRWSSLPTSRERATPPRNSIEVSRSTLELVSHSRVTFRMQTLCGVCTTSRRPKSYHDLRQCHPRLLSPGGRDTLCDTQNSSSAPSTSPSGIEAMKVLTTRTFVEPELQVSYPAA